MLFHLRFNFTVPKWRNTPTFGTISGTRLSLLLASHLARTHSRMGNLHGKTFYYHPMALFQMGTWISIIHGATIAPEMRYYIFRQSIEIGTPHFVQSVMQLKCLMCMFHKKLFQGNTVCCIHIDVMLKHVPVSLIVSYYSTNACFGSLVVIQVAIKKLYCY